MPEDLIKKLEAHYKKCGSTTYVKREDTYCCKKCEQVVARLMAQEEAA